MAIKLEKKHYKYTTAMISGALFASVLIGFFLIRPSVNSNAEKAKEVKENREVLSILEDRLSKLKELKDDEERLTAEKDKVLDALPEDKDVPRLFVQFENMVAGTGASVKSASENAAVQTASSVNISGVTNHIYGIKFDTSTYESVKNVVTNSEVALRLVNLDTIKINLGENNFSVELGLNTFSREKKTEVKK